MAASFIPCSLKMRRAPTAWPPRCRCCSRVSMWCDCSIRLAGVRPTGLGAPRHRRAVHLVRRAAVGRASGCAHRLHRPRQAVAYITAQPRVLWEPTAGRCSMPRSFTTCSKPMCSPNDGAGSTTNADRTTGFVTALRSAPTFRHKEPSVGIVTQIASRMKKGSQSFSSAPLFLMS